MASWNIPKKIILRHVVMLYHIFFHVCHYILLYTRSNFLSTPQISNTLSNLMLKSAKSDPSLFFLVSNQHLFSFATVFIIFHPHFPLQNPDLHPPTSIWRQATRTSKHTPTTSARNRPRRRPAAKQPTMRLTMAASTLSSEDFGCNDFKGAMDPIHLWRERDRYIYMYINNHPLYSI